MSLFERSLRQQAEDLANTHYHALEGEVIRTVRANLMRRKIRLDTSDLEAAYCQAWHGVCLQIERGVSIRDLRAMLVTITCRRAIDTYRRMRLGVHVDVELESYGFETDFAERMDDKQKLRRLVTRLRTRLNDNECKAVGLCVMQGYGRSDAAKLLGMSEPPLQRIMDSATRKIRGVVAEIDARGCGDDEWSRLLRAYALKTLPGDNRDYRRVQAHIENCETCRRYVHGLRGSGGHRHTPAPPAGAYRDTSPNNLGAP